MNVKTFKKAEKLIGKVEKYQEIVDLSKISYKKLSWMKLQIHGRDTEETARDIDMTLFGDTEENVSLIKAMIELVGDHYKNLLEELEMELEEL